MLTALGTVRGERPWGPAFVWLCFLAPLFFITYLGTLEIVSWRARVPVILFEWERHIPFMAWTIVPYWSIDALYGLSLFLCVTRDELNRHAYRLVSAQIIAIAIFVAAPLKLVSEIPAETGVFSVFFAALEDVVGKPFNLAPSLHIALLIILWARYAAHVPARWHWLMHIWAVLIGVSVMTAYQHHFFDVPTGMMLGFFCLWLWPEKGPCPLAAARITQDPQRRRLAMIYAAGAVALIVLAWIFWGTALWLLWPAQSLALIALAYGAIGVQVFQKDETGAMSLAAQWLLWPYLAAARINARAWTRNLSDSVEVAAPVHIGRLPNAVGASQHVIDLSAELKAPAGAANWHALPALDLVTPPPSLLCSAARRIEKACDAEERQGQPVLVCCALGFSRSAAAVVTWLAGFGHAASIDAAIATLRSVRPQIVLGAIDRLAISDAVRLLRDDRP